MAMLVGLSLTVVAQQPVTLRPAEELDALLAPVALYPDALIAVMLPAATAPADVVQAARYLAAGGAVELLDAQPWDDSVRTLAHYPELTQWMAANVVWTMAVGDAFRAQPADVMAAIQRLRTRAQALGNLTSTPQQRVISDQNVITIVPGDADVVYVPQYDPQVVYLQPAPFGGSWISYGFWWRIGAWHRYDFDWRRCDVRIREQHPQFRHPVEVIHAWHPAPVAQHQSAMVNRTPAATQAHAYGVTATPHVQANQVVVPKTPAVIWPTQREAQQHNAIVTHSVEHTPEPVNMRHEVGNTRDRDGENHGTINRANVPQPAVQHNVPVARPEPRAVPQPVNAPVAPVNAPAIHHDAAARQALPAVMQHNISVMHVQAPAVAQPAPYARPDIRQAPTPMARPNVASVPQPAPHVMRSAPAPQPAAQPVVVHAAQAQHQAPPSGNNQSGNAPGNGDRGNGGHWGNMARGN